MYQILVHTCYLHNKSALLTNNQAIKFKQTSNTKAQKIRDPIFVTIISTFLLHNAHGVKFSIGTDVCKEGVEYGTMNHWLWTNWPVESSKLVLYELAYLL